MNNTLGDLNNHLFAQLEKLGDDDLSDEKLDEEIRRADAMMKIGKQIVEVGELQFKVMQHMDEYMLFCKLNDAPVVTLNDAITV